MRLNIIFVTFYLASSLAAAMEFTEFINFFTTSDHKMMVGLSCSSEEECKALCNGSENCQKPVDTCLNCITSRSPYISDFFNNMAATELNADTSFGQTSTAACFDQGNITFESKALFDSVAMIPLTPTSAANPYDFKNPEMLEKFSKLCPEGSGEPVAIAFTDRLTQAVLELPLVKCGKTIYPLVHGNEDCASKFQWIQKFIRSASATKFRNSFEYRTALANADRLPLKYDILRLSETSESQYVGCSRESAAICDSLCQSSLSCALPLDNSRSSSAISTFNKQEWKACEVERFSPELLVSYLSAKDVVSFSAQSLAQSYLLPAYKQDGGFSDLSNINAILNDFQDVFVSSGANQDSGTTVFLISNTYREKLAKRMQSFCDAKTDPIIFGRGDKIERVFCRSELNGYFRVLTSKDENCLTKKNSLNSNLQNLKNPILNSPRGTL